MDQTVFDSLAWGLAGGQISRRHALKKLCAGFAGGILGGLIPTSNVAKADHTTDAIEDVIKEALKYVPTCEDLSNIEICLPSDFNACEKPAGVAYALGVAACAKAATVPLVLQCLAPVTAVYEASVAVCCSQFGCGPINPICCGRHAHQFMCMAGCSPIQQIDRDSCQCKCPRDDQVACGPECCIIGQTTCCPPTPSGAGFVYCVDLRSDPLNCGMCGHRCGDGQGCIGGMCICSDGREPCNNMCCAPDKVCKAVNDPVGGVTFQCTCSSSTCGPCETCNEITGQCEPKCPDPCLPCVNGLCTPKACPCGQTCVGGDCQGILMTCPTGQTLNSTTCLCECSTGTPCGPLCCPPGSSCCGQSHGIFICSPPGGGCCGPPPLSCAPGTFCCDGKACCPVGMGCAPGGGCFNLP
jgi:hypothetical protein